MLSSRATIRALLALSSSLSLTSSHSVFYSTSSTFFLKMMASVEASVSFFSHLVLSLLFLSSLFIFFFPSPLFLSSFSSPTSSSWQPWRKRFYLSFVFPLKPIIFLVWYSTKILIIYCLMNYKIWINCHWIIVNNLTQTNKTSI